ncbi:hypothetical protein TNCT_378561 [Trichonephila clavata]|uniref:Uncharacterized protein n=1 Tax=Trichonephila clavata TaxID=2740835 RepID=A0A8X6L8V7_TRICU|nr:hypothetical protein TNCT_378561 [Trichonephila clavata]
MQHKVNMKKRSTIGEYLLTGVVSVVEFLLARDFPFRSYDKQLGSTIYGHFLGCLEVISAFDPFLSEHLTTYGNKGK